MSRPTCRTCGNPAMSQGYVNGKKRYKAYCTQCKRKKYRLAKRGFCQVCGFIPDWLGQLDVDHIDGNKANNEASNLMTLCANCHRLKTHRSRDYDPIRLGTEVNDAPQLPLEP